MFDSLPTQIDERVRAWTWDDDIKPYFDDLMARELTADNINQWLADWNAISKVLWEMISRARVATTQNTVDEDAEAFYTHLLENIIPHLSVIGNMMNKKLVDSGLEPDNFALSLKKMRTDIELFREANIPLSTEEQKLGMAYAKITGAQTVEWDGKEQTLTQMRKAMEDDDRDRREAAWRLMMDRWLQDREAINDVWTKLFKLRGDMAANAGFDNYRDFRWQQFKRFDYSPQDCETFHKAIEAVVVPAAKRAHERRRQRMGVDTLRPWDLNVDPSGREPLRPWETISEFAEKAETIFNNVDPQLGGYYATMRAEDLMDLPNRKNKGPGAYCTTYPLIGRPFVFMNAAGTRDDVRTLLHEVGHAFHGFETQALPYLQQRAYPIEFAEVASMAMELLAAPYLKDDLGGYYSVEEAARDRVSHLEKILLFWPYMAVVDGFQHWVYTSGDAAADPANCDAKWAELWDRFDTVDYSGFDDVKATGWHRKQHIYRYPFYYVEYGLAQLGAVQVWANALDDQAAAVANYRKALALGGTRNLHDLYGTAGAKFAFDEDTLGKAVELIEKTITEMDAVTN